MVASLYERLGGAKKIFAIANDFVELHRINPIIGPRFKVLNDEQVARAKKHAAEFFCAGSGGPETYHGKDLVSAHKGMNINEQELVAAIDDVVAALQKHGIGQQEINDVVAILYSLKGQVLRL